MTTAVQWRRGSQNQNDNFLGYEGEITVDTTNWDLRIHDGKTRGGHSLGNNNGSGGRVSSVAIDASKLGLQTGNAVTTSGTISLTGVVNVASGGTGTANPLARGRIPLEVLGTWPNVVVALTGIVSVANGGTGVSDASLIAGNNIDITGSWPNQTISMAAATTPTAIGGRNISIGADNSINLDGIVDVANGGTGTNNPLITGTAPLLVTGDWPNQIVSFSGVLPVSQGGNGVTNPRITGDDNFIVTGDWPNQQINLASHINVTSINGGTYPTGYPAIGLATSNNEIQILSNLTSITFGNDTANSLAKRKAIFQDDGNFCIYDISNGKIPSPDTCLFDASTAYNSTTSATAYPPALVVYSSASSTCTYINTSPNTLTTLKLDTILLDTNSWFNTTNYRYTPTKAGWYRVSLTMTYSAIGTGAYTTSLLLMKNTVCVGIHQQLINYTSGYSQTLQINTIVSLNGTSEYLWAELGTNSGTITSLTGQLSTYMAIDFIRPL